MTCKTILSALLTIIGTINATAGCLNAQQAEKKATVDLAVMSFNIRNGRANDGENSWNHRKEFAADVIRQAKPDVAGLQEAYRFQLDDLRKQLPGFDEVGEGRDGGSKGEYSAILYRKSRFTAVDTGTFWLSDTPETKSRSWGNRYLRICTWVRLMETESKQHFYVYNTHFDHQSQNARIQSALLIARRINNRKHRDPFVLMGDFNADEDNPVILYLKHKSPASVESPIRLIDTFRSIHPDEKNAGTGGGFEGRADGKKIDYIFVEADTEVIGAEIIRTNQNGRYPSDHAPVTAEIRFPLN